MNEITVSSFADLDDVQRAAKMMLSSGYFEAQRDPAVGVAQLAVKILAGREMGYGPFAAVQGINVIQGKPALSANLMAAAVKASPRYDYRVRKMDATECSIEFFERHGVNRESIGTSTFTAADARTAGVKNMDKFPRNMLFARALSNGVRWFCPDVFSGSAVYVPEEFGAMVDGDTGEIIDAEPARQAAQRPLAPRPASVTPVTPPEPEAETPADNPFLDSPQPEPERLDAITPGQLKMLHALGVQVYGDAEWKTKRLELVTAVTRGERSSAADLTKSEAKTLIDGLLKRTGQSAPTNAELADVEPLPH